MQDKISEELLELRETAFNDIEEYADVIEVLFSMAKFQGISEEEIFAARKKKLDSKGGFESFLLLKMK